MIWECAKEVWPLHGGQLNVALSSDGLASLPEQLRTLMLFLSLLQNGQGTFASGVEETRWM